MNKSLNLLLVGLFMLVATQAMANGVIEPGDLGSFECRQVQLEAQEAVLAGMPYDNHGGMVSTAAKVVSGYAFRLVDGITCECASCIVHQFAHSTPIEEQEPCGPDAEVKDLLGPDTGSCDGPPVGKTKIIDLGESGLRVDVEFTNGPPNLTVTVWWVCTNVPGGCHGDACGAIILGDITTDSNGKGLLSTILSGGNPYPGKYVHFDVGIQPSGPWYTSVAHDTVFPIVSTFTTINIENAPSCGTADGGGDPTN